MVERSRHQVYTLAFYSLGSRDEAEDVTQEVFVRLWEHWKEIEHSTAMAWIIRVTKNVCLDLHRKRQTRNALMAVHGEACLVPEPSSAMNPEVAYERKDFRARVERALCEMDEPYRTIVVLREIEDYSYAEICDAMEMPLNTVKVYLHRGRRMLRERMRREAGVGSVARAAQMTDISAGDHDCHFVRGDRSNGNYGSDRGKARQSRLEAVRSLGIDPAAAG
jgi:RNA polymerase sigma-70 factor (ECF subfamily)